MNDSRYKLHYKGSLFWLIFWIIFFFPIAFVLLLTASTFDIDKTSYTLQYDGSRGWLCFWVLVFFPVAFILLLVNGFSVVVKNLDSPIVTPAPSCCCQKDPINTDKP